MKKVILAVGGGIAAYKSAMLSSGLVKMGFDCRVLMSYAATKFIKPLTFEAILGKKVFTSVFPNSTESRQDIYPHLYPATECELFVLAPATANLIAKIAHGIADDIVTSSVLSLPKSCIRLICPAMNKEMWNQDAVQSNIKVLKSRGFIILGPETGSLACGVYGEGRMVEPLLIQREIERLINLNESVLKDKKVLILSGPTREYLDPVRYISNCSSGQMGLQLAQAFLSKNASVTFISGPVKDYPFDTSSASKLKLVHIESASQMLIESKKVFPLVDWIIYVAAVSDFKAKTVSQKKLSKNQALNDFQLELNPDIAAVLSSKKTKSQKILGFALESDYNINNATEKMENKHLDAIVLNGPESMGSTSARFMLITSDSKKEWGQISKADCANKIVSWFSSNKNDGDE